MLAKRPPLALFQVQTLGGVYLGDVVMWMAPGRGLRRVALGRDKRSRKMGVEGHACEGSDAQLARCQVAGLASARGAAAVTGQFRTPSGSARRLPRGFHTACRHEGIDFVSPRHGPVVDVRLSLLAGCVVRDDVVCVR